MRRLMLPLLLLASAADARVPLGQFARWGAFRDGGRCFAIAEPLGRGGGSLAVLSGGGARAQLHVRLGRTLAGKQPSLVVDGRRFPLTMHDGKTWVPSAAADLRILQVLRRAKEAIVAAGRIRERYSLVGAPSAIDAALLGCLP